MAEKTPSSDLVKLGRGKLLFDRFDASGLRTGFVHLGNCDKFAISMATETIKQKNYMTATAAPYKEARISTDVTVSITGFEFSPSVMAMVLSGDKAFLTQTAGSATGEVIATIAQAEKGKLYTTAKREISAVVVKQGATTLVLGTDYEVFNAKRGVIRILPTSPSFTDGAAVTADYTAAAITTTALAVQVVRGAKAAKIEGRLLFLADNAAGANDEVEAWRVSLSPDGELNFISDEWAKWGMKGSVLDDAAGQYGGSIDSPYYDHRTPAAA
jgi:hypothetical protein